MVNEHESIKTGAVRDQANKKDALGFQPYVHAIERFLSDEDTIPPLTMSVEGEWGSGKSTFMNLLQDALEKKNHITIHFNAWRHDKEDALWAAFALEFLNQISRKVSLWECVKGFWNLRVKRFDWKNGWKDLFLVLSSAIGWALWLFIWILFFGLFGLYWIGNQPIRFIDFIFSLSLSSKPLWAKGINGIVCGSGLLVLFPYMQSITKKLKEHLAHPLKIDLKKHLKSPDYEERVSFIEKFHADFKRIVESYAKDKKVFVFIDDLDRCEIPKAAELMQAINLMISEDLPLIFIMGLDREKVAAGIAVKSENLLPYLSAHSINTQEKDRTTKSDPYDGLRYGYQFIEKFIQLPFKIPQADKDDLITYLNSLSEKPEEEKRGKLESIIIKIKEYLLKIIGKIKDYYTEQEEGESVNGHGGVYDQTHDYKEPNQFSTVDQTNTTDETSELEELDRQKKEDKKRKEFLQIYSGEDSDRIKQIQIMAASALNYNPRRIKQFINLFRLQVCIGFETGIFKESPTATDITLEKLGKLVAISLAWPIFMYDLDKDHQLLTKLQHQAFEDKIPESKERNRYYQRWSKRQDLLTFLGHRIEGLDEKEYSLEGMDLNKLLKILPRITMIGSLLDEPDIDKVGATGESDKDEEKKPPKLSLDIVENKSGDTILADLHLDKGLKPLELVRIKPGAFLMGSPENEHDRVDEREGIQHELKINNEFYMGKYPVTQAQWETVMGNNPSRFENNPNHPVESVNWDQTKEFLVKLNQSVMKWEFRLPTEAEWEYACRAGTSTRFYWGDDPDKKLIDKYCWYENNSDGKTNEVGVKEPNKWQIHEMCGNVWEWCEDNWHENYDNAPSDGQAWIDSSKREGSGSVMRGGSWGVVSGRCRSSSRDWTYRDNRADGLGFRVIYSRTK